MGSFRLLLKARQFLRIIVLLGSFMSRVLSVAFFVIIKHNCHRHTAEFRKLAWSALLAKTEFPYRRRLGCEIIRSCSSFPQNFKISVETKVSQSRALLRPHCKNAYCNTCCRLQRIMNICILFDLYEPFCLCVALTCMHYLLLYLLLRSCKTCERTMKFTKVVAFADSGRCWHIWRIL